MAEIQTTSSSKHKGVKRLIKKSTRVDLTPMVDLGFLLITFFVFTSALSKPKVMDIVTPIDSGNPTSICESCVLTVMLEKDNSISYYEGMPGENTVLQQTAFNEEGIRSVLTRKKEMVKQARGSADDMVLIIKPTDVSVYRNFVDILDEAAITGVKHYFIDEINDADKALLSKNHR
jgi:biopolymer transport protein ExbD